MHTTLRAALRLPLAPLLLSAGLALAGPFVAGAPQDLPADDGPATRVRAAIGPAPLLVLRDDTQARVHGQLSLTAGSLRDPADRPGLAALAAAALRAGGCEAFSGPELDAWLQERGAEAAFTTTSDHLQVSFSCATEDLAGLLTRLGQLLAAPAFDPAATDLARERLEAALVRAAGDDAMLADQALERLLYGSRSPHGRSAGPGSLAAIGAADLAAWAERNLGLDRMHLGLVGDLDPEQATAWATAAFEDLPRVGPARPVAEPEFWIPEHTRIFVVDRPDATRTQLRLAVPGVRLDDPDQPTLSLWSRVVGFGGASHRIAERLQVELGLVERAGCLFLPSPARRGSLYAYADPRHDAVDEALSELLDLITETGATRIAKDELEAARGRTLDGLAEVHGPGWALSRAMTLELFGYPEDFWERNLEHLAAVDAQDVVEAVRRRIPPARFLVVAVGPADEIVPRLEAVAEVELLEPEVPLASGDEVVATMLAALGGAEAWARLNTVHVEMTVEVAYTDGAIAKIPVEQHRSFEPLSIRMKQVTPSGATYTNVIHDGVGRLKSPTGQSDVPAEQVRAWQDQLARWLYYNLHRLAAGDEALSAGLDGDGRLVLLGTGGELCWIELDADGRPARLGVRQSGAEKVFEYSDWTETEGIWYAARFVEDGNQTATLQVFEPFVDLPASTWEL